MKCPLIETQITNDPWPLTSANIYSVQDNDRSAAIARVITVREPVSKPVSLESEAPFAIETLLYAIRDPPQPELTVLTASRTSVALSVDDGVEREDV